MPVHVHPILRNREAALEAIGLLVKQNSVAYTQLVAAETQGLKAKHIPNVTFYFNGSVFVAKE